jgi:YggT family protein
MHFLIDLGYFLFATFFSLISFILWVRIAIRYVRLSRLHPASRLIYQLTDPIVMPIAHHFPHAQAPKNIYDWPCLAVLVLVDLLKFISLGALFLGAMLPWGFLPLYIFADLLLQPCNLLFYAIILHVLISWLNPHWQHPIVDVLRLVTQPLLNWARHKVPVMHGFDFSPLLLLILLKLISFIIRAPLPLHIL